MAPPRFLPLLLAIAGPSPPRRGPPFLQPDLQLVHDPGDAVPGTTVLVGTLRAGLTF